MTSERCRWCKRRHAPGELCRPGRRSFFFLGLGVLATGALVPKPSYATMHDTYLKASGLPPYYGGSILEPLVIRSRGARPDDFADFVHATFSMYQDWTYDFKNYIEHRGASFPYTPEGRTRHRIVTRATPRRVPRVRKMSSVPAASSVERIVPTQPATLLFHGDWVAGFGSFGSG